MWVFRRFVDFTDGVTISFLIDAQPNEFHETSGFGGVWNAFYLDGEERALDWDSQPMLQWYHLHIEAANPIDGDIWLMGHVDSRGNA
eukprot:gene14300-16913_t